MDSEPGREQDGGKKKVGRPRNGGGPGVRAGRPRKTEEGSYYQARGLRAPYTRYTAPPTTVKTRLATGALAPVNYGKGSSETALLPSRSRGPRSQPHVQPPGQARGQHRLNIPDRGDQGDNDQRDEEDDEEHAIQEGTDSAIENQFVDDHHLFEEDNDRFEGPSESPSLRVRTGDTSGFSSNDTELVPNDSDITQACILPGSDGPTGGVTENEPESSSQRPATRSSNMPPNPSSFRRARDDTIGDLGLFEYLTRGRSEIRSKSQVIPESPRKRRLASLSPSRRPAKRRATIFDTDYDERDRDSDNDDVHVSSIEGPGQDEEQYRERRQDETRAFENNSPTTQGSHYLDSDDGLDAELHRLTQAMEKMALVDRHSEPKALSPTRTRGRFSIREEIIPVTEPPHVRSEEYRRRQYYMEKRHSSVRDREMAPGRHYDDGSGDYSWSRRHRLMRD